MIGENKEGWARKKEPDGSFLVDRIRIALLCDAAKDEAE